MAQEYPATPATLKLIGNFTGVFDPVAGTPALVNGIGTTNRRYRVRKSGAYNFATGTPGSGTSLVAGDEVMYVNGVWQRIETSTAGDALPRDGTLPMEGPLDTDGHPVLLKDGAIRGSSDSERALVEYVEAHGGDFDGRINLLTVRAKESGNAAEPELLTGELGVDVLVAQPVLWVGINGSGDIAVLVGPTRQIELTGNQTIAGTKTFRSLRFGASGQEMTLPTTRGEVGEAPILQADGEIVWGSVQLSANAAAITLSGGSTVLEAFNESGPHTIGQADLVFITWSNTLYVWSGGPGTFGVGETQAVEGNIVGPVLSFAGVAFATQEEVDEGTEDAKAIAPDVAASSLLKLNGADQQECSTPILFTGTLSLDETANISGAINVLEGGLGTINDAPRVGEEGEKDIVNRAALDARFQASTGISGAENAGKAPIMDANGKITRGVMNGIQLMDFQGYWNPNSTGGDNLHNGVSSGGSDPVADGGDVWIVSAEGRWNFTTGAIDPSSPLLSVNTLLIWDRPSMTWIQIPTSGGGAGAGAMLRDGTTSMTGNLRFETGLAIRGSGASTPVLIENALLDGGTF